MLSLWLRFLRYWMPAYGRHSSPIESGGYPVLKPDPVWGELPDDEGTWLEPEEADGQENFPIACANGCPEGYLGRHKFSCPELRETRQQYYETYRVCPVVPAHPYDSQRR
jgi:hypothetical protein